MDKNEINKNKIQRYLKRKKNERCTLPYKSSSSDIKM